MDIEKLLGKLLHEVKDSGGDKFKKKYKDYKKDGKKKYKKYKKKKYHKKDREYADRGSHVGKSSSHRDKKTGNGLMDSLTGNLTSGKGLLTAIGLGVGAYEIYRSSRRPQAATGAVPPPTGQTIASPPPPPPPPRQEQATPDIQPPTSSIPQPEATAVDAAMQPKAPTIVTQLDEQEIARRFIQIMVGAAHADGTLDADEEKAILERLRGVELDQEEKMFLLGELHHPRTIAELATGIDDDRLAQAMYAVAVSTVVIDTGNERQWLDDLGTALNISPDLCGFIEENH